MKRAYASIFAVFIVVALFFVFIENKKEQNKAEAVAHKPVDIATNSTKEAGIKEKPRYAPLTPAQQDIFDKIINETPFGRVTLFYYLNKVSIAMGERCPSSTLYCLCYMQLIQKVDQGYLMQYNPPDGGGGEYEIAFLATDEPFPENYTFLDQEHWVISNGLFKYRAVNGFDREIYSFALLNDHGNRIVSDRFRKINGVPGK